MKAKFKNWFIITFLLLSMSGIATSIQAQNDAPQNAANDKKERVEALRIAYLTNRLNLSAEEAQRFWPIFNQYKGDLKTLRQNFHPKGATIQLTADQELEFEQKKLDLKKRYKPQFESTIGKEKVNRLVTAEEDFKKELMRIMRERRDARGPKPAMR